MESVKAGDFKHRKPIPIKRIGIKMAKNRLFLRIRSLHASSRIRIAARTPSNRASARHGIRTKPAIQLCGLISRIAARAKGAVQIPPRTHAQGLRPVENRTISGYSRNHKIVPNQYAADGQTAQAVQLRDAAEKIQRGQVDEAFAVNDRVTHESFLACSANCAFISRVEASRCSGVANA